MPDSTSNVEIAQYSRNSIWIKKGPYYTKHMNSVSFLEEIKTFTNKLQHDVSNLVLLFILRHTCKSNIKLCVSGSVL